VAHELPPLGPRRGEAAPVDHVIEPPLQQGEQHLAGDPLLPFGFLEIAAELGLQHAVDPFHLLLLAKLQAVAHDLLLAGPAVLAGRIGAARDGAGVLEAAVTFQEKLGALTAAQPAYGFFISGHG